MKIKPFILAFVLASTSLVASAQKGELSSAKSNYDQYIKFKDANSLRLGVPALTLAKASIDKVVVHEKTQSEPSAWTYKALIYSDLALLDTIPTTSKPLFTEAVTAFTKAKELDKEGANKANLEKINELLAQYELNQGVKAYQSSKFEEAYNAFNSSLNYHPGDTTLLYYSGLAAVNSKNNKAAIKQYEALTKTNFSANPQIYLDLSRLYSMEKDTAAAIKVASEGAKKYNNATLATQEIELSLLSGKQKEVIAQITEQAEKNPKNKLYPFYLGIAYASMNNNPKAEESYKKAIEIDANYADANLNLGNLILNLGIDLYKKANKLPQSKQKEYDVMMKQASVEFDRAFPYLQKALELSPNSRSVLENLKTYYIIKKNQPKVDEITQKLAAMKE